MQYKSSVGSVTLLLCDGSYSCSSTTTADDEAMKQPQHLRSTDFESEIIPNRKEFWLCHIEFWSKRVYNVFLL